MPWHDLIAYFDEAFALERERLKVQSQIFGDASAVAMSRLFRKRK